MFEKYTDAETFAKIVDYPSVNDMWAHCVSEYASLSAIEDSEGKHTYAELDNEISQLRAILADNNVKKGEFVGIYMPNSYSFVKAYLAAVTSGYIAVLIPFGLDGQTLKGLCMKMHIKTLFYNDASSPIISQVQLESVVPCVHANSTSTKSLPATPVNTNEPCCVVFTGGTTGKSKGALLSHKAVMMGTRNGCYGLKKVFHERYLLVLPLTHVFGLIRNLMTCLYTGSTMFICKQNTEMFRDIAVFKPTILVVVPALAEMALNLSKQFKRNMLGEDMKTIICGAAFVPPYLSQEYRKLGISLFPGYGLTESANLVSGNPEVESKPTSVGIPYPNQELKVVDGELWLKGDNMMMKYLDEEENKLAYEDGYFKTGDLVKIDEEGFLYIVGRKKDIIVLSSGLNISPEEVEGKFNQLDFVQDCLVYGSEDNSTLVLEILPRKAMLPSLPEEELEAYMKKGLEDLNKTLPSHQRISKIIIRKEDFKRSPSLKILRKQQ